MALVVGWLGLAMAPGCGGDPASGRLDQGSAARAYSPDGSPVRVFFADRVEKTAASTRVKVLTDAEGVDADVHRRVVIAIEEGNFRGMAAQMERADLRTDE